MPSARRRRRAAHATSGRLADVVDRDPLSPGGRTVARALAAAWRPRPRATTHQWCTDHLRFDARHTAGDARFNTARWPWIEGMLAAVDDPDVREITIVSSSQIGKTTALVAVLTSRAVLGPAPAMIAGPNKDYLIELRDKVYECCLASSALAELVPPRHRWNDRSIDLATCLTYLAWSGSLQRLAGRACQFVLLSEVDRWSDSPREGQTSQIVQARTQAFHRWCVLRESSPTNDDSPIWAFYLLSDQRTYQVPCPRCGHHQALRFFPHRSGPYSGCGGVVGWRDRQQRPLSADAARASAHYLCERGCRIEDSDKPWMVERGVWVPRGQTVDRHGQLSGQPLRSAHHSGYHVWAGYADTITFGDLAARWIDCTSSEERRVFFNTVLGLKWSGKKRVPEWQELGRRLAAAHRRGSVPAAAIFLTLAADKQADGVYWVCRAWGEGATSWLVDWGYLRRRVGDDGSPLRGSDLSQLDALLERAWPLVSPGVGGLRAMRVRLAGCDIGYQPIEVAEWVRTHPGDRVRCLAGDPSLRTTLWRATPLDRTARDGKPYPEGTIRWGLATGQLKSDLADRWSAALDRPGAWLLCDRILDEGRDYLEQLTSERPTDKIVRGRAQTIWEPRYEGASNHYWDAEVYNRALAEMVTEGHWTGLADQLVAELAASQPTPARKKNDSGGEPVREYDRPPL